MLKRLRKKWNVSATQFWVIFITFGCTGITTAYLTKAITEILAFTGETHWSWKLTFRLAMLLVGYHVILLSFGALFGQ